MNYPEWVCFECGKKYGKRIPSCCSIHIGVCGVCGELLAVTEPRDFGHLNLPNIKKGESYESSFQRDGHD